MSEEFSIRETLNLPTGDNRELVYCGHRIPQPDCEGCDPLWRACIEGCLHPKCVAYYDELEERYPRVTQKVTRLVDQEIQTEGL